MERFTIQSHTQTQQHPFSLLLFHLPPFLLRLDSNLTYATISSSQLVSYINQESLCRDIVLEDTVGKHADELKE